MVRPQVGQASRRSGLKLDILDLFPQAGVGRGWQADVNAVLVAGDGATGHVGDEAAGSQAQITLDVHEGLGQRERD